MSVISFCRCIDNSHILKKELICDCLRKPTQTIGTLLADAVVISYMYKYIAIPHNGIDHFSFKNDFFFQSKGYPDVGNDRHQNPELSTRNY